MKNNQFANRRELRTWGGTGYDEKTLIWKNNSQSESIKERKKVEFDKEKQKKKSIKKKYIIV